MRKRKVILEETDRQVMDYLREETERTGWAEKKQHVSGMICIRRTA